MRLRRGRSPPRSAAIGRARRRAGFRRAAPCRRPPRSSRDRRPRIGGDARRTGHIAASAAKAAIPAMMNHTINDPRERPAPGRDNSQRSVSAKWGAGLAKGLAQTLARHRPAAVRLLAGDALAAVRPSGNVDGLRIGATAAARSRRRVRRSRRRRARRAMSGAVRNRARRPAPARPPARSASLSDAPIGPPRTPPSAAPVGNGRARPAVAGGCGDRRRRRGPPPHRPEPRAATRDTARRFPGRACETSLHCSSRTGAHRRARSDQAQGSRRIARKPPSGLSSSSSEPP